VTGGSIVKCGHFIPEERPDEVVRHILAMTAKAPRIHKQHSKKELGP